MRVLIGCEYSGRMRDAFLALGHDAWSCDYLPSESDPTRHLQCDVLTVLDQKWDLAIFHPDCTRLANSGGRWLNVPPTGRTREDIQEEFEKAVAFYLALRHAPIPRIAIENPVFNGSAKARINPPVARQVVQPWWFGDPAFKATGFELKGLPRLVPTDKLVPPIYGEPGFKEWSFIHRAPPGPERWKLRSRTFPGMAKAAAEQWGKE